jgi:MFS family permease
MRVRYGWVVVAAAFTVMFVGFGVAYGFAAFFRTFVVEFNANRGDISLIFALSGFLYFVLGAVSGPLADRFGPRPVVIFGMVLIGGGLLVASAATNLQQIYLSYGIAVGVGIGFSYVPSVGAVQRWFVRRRAMASGIAVSGIGFGTLVGPPLAGWLIGQFDWRHAYQILGVATMLVGTVAGYLLSRPGPSGRSAAAEGVVLGGMTLRQALGTRPFWMIFIASMANSFAIFVPFVHLLPYAVDRGHSETVGLGLMGIIGVGSIVGRFAIGALGDRIGRRRTFTAQFAGIGLMMVWWWGSTEVWSLVVFALIFGALYGGFVALAPALSTDYFGGRHISGILGCIYSGVGIGTLIGPTLAGVAFDRYQSYDLPILVAAAITVISVVCSGWMLRDPEPD